MRKLLGHIIFSFGERVKLQLVRARTINYMGDFRLQSTPPPQTPNNLTIRLLNTISHITFCSVPLVFCRNYNIKKIIL